MGRTKTTKTEPQKTHASDVDRAQGNEPSETPLDGDTSAAFDDAPDFDSETSVADACVDDTEERFDDELFSDLAHRYLEAIGSISLLAPQEELALARRAKAGDKAARQQMIESNLRLGEHRQTLSTSRGALPRSHRRGQPGVDACAGKI